MSAGSWTRPTSAPSAGAPLSIDGKNAVAHADTGDQRIACEHLILATGSEPAALPHLPFGGDVLSSTGALALTRVPEKLAVVGAGYIGMELGMAFAKLGASVTVVEALPKILPLYDEELTLPVARRAADLGIDVMLGARALGHDKGGLRVEDANGAETTVSADKVLIAVGRRPRTENFGLERLDLTMAGPFIRIDDRCATSMRNVWAVGDVTGEPMLAHRAMAQGEMVAEIIAGKRRAFDHRAIAVRLFHRSGDRRGRPLARGGAGCAWRDSDRPFPLPRQRPGDDQAGRRGFRPHRRAQGQPRRARRAGRRRRRVRTVSSAFSMAIEMGARLEDVALTIHAHPTQSEAFHEAALKALGMPLHI